jgi:hypothetical protein
MDVPLTPDEVAECNREQILEMEKHRYIESQKAQKDLGKAAYTDWITKYAQPWRDAWMRRRNQRLHIKTHDSNG